MRTAGRRLSLLAVLVGLSTTGWSAAVHVPVSGGQRLLYSRSFALIIAQENYQHAAWDRLDQVPADVARLRSALLNLGFEAGDITVKPDLKSGELLGKIQSFINSPAHRESTVRLFIFYAGHGLTTNLNQTFLVPVDAPGPTDNEFYEKAVLLTSIKGVVANATARHTLLVFDSCFSGAIFAHRSAPQMTALHFEDLEKTRIQVITAGNADQKVPADSEFVKAFVVGAGGQADLDFNGIVTATELTIYLKKNVEETTPQGGTIGLETGGEFAFIPNPGKVAFHKPDTSIPKPPKLPPVDSSPIEPPPKLVEYSLTCRYTSGPKLGQTQRFPTGAARPAIVGFPCQDAQGSAGYAIPDDPATSSTAITLSSVCKFTSGPRAGQSQDYAPMPAVPLGTACQDGAGSAGSVVKPPGK